MTLVIPKFEGEHFWLSNFYEHEITFPLRALGKEQNIKFKTNEAAFQACKYKAMKGSSEEKVAYVKEVSKAKTPKQSKLLGRLADIDVSKWDDIKIDVMREVCRVKFDDAKMQSLLLATGPAMLVEGNTWDDKFWGRVDGRGYNMLGVILMEIRGYHRIRLDPPF